MRSPLPLLVLFVVACGGQSGENPIDRPTQERNFCTLSLELAQTVAVSCPNAYTAPPQGDEESLRERPAYEVQAYLAYTWDEATEEFLGGVQACGFDLDYFSGVDPAEFGIANAGECVELKACLDEEGITFPEEWPETSYFDFLPEGEDTCGLQSLE
jgi:hypothetical protein